MSRAVGADRRSILQALGAWSLGSLIAAALPRGVQAGVDRTFYFVRISEGPDGRSYIEEYDPRQLGAKEPVIYQAPAVSVALLRWPAGTVFNWGPTHGGVHRLLVTATGLTVTIVDDGAETGRSYHPLKPGSVMLAEDFAGRGHRGRVLPGEDAIVFQVDLA